MEYRKPFKKQSKITTSEATGGFSLGAERKLEMGICAGAAPSGADTRAEFTDVIDKRR